MAPSPQKNPIQKSLNQWLERQQDSFGNLLQKSIPCTVLSVENNNTIVTVKVEIQVDGYNWPTIRVPVGTPKYQRYPLKKGDPGVLLSSDFYMGGMSGIGGGTAHLTKMANLSTGIFFPIGTTSDVAPTNPNANEFSAPDGFVAKTDDGGTIFKLNKEGIMMQFGPHTIQITLDGVFIDGINFLPHHHSGVQSGGSNTGPVSG